MFATPAYAQAVGAAAGGGGLMAMLVQFFPFLLIIVAFYFLLLRPQQQQAKRHREKIGAIKRGDTVVLSSGVIGKVMRVEEAEIGIEVAQGVTVKVVKSMVSDVRTRGAPVAANDAKA
jgi:preprotein translocase subunit YajC